MPDSPGKAPAAALQAEDMQQDRVDPEVGLVVGTALGLVVGTAGPELGLVVGTAGPGVGTAGPAEPAGPGVGRGHQLGKGHCVVKYLQNKSILTTNFYQTS